MGDDKTEKAGDRQGARRGTTESESEGGSIRAVFLACREEPRQKGGDAFSMMSAFGRTSVEPVYKSIKATSNHSSLPEEFMAARSIS